MTYPTASDFENAKQDLDTLSDLVNSTESKDVDTRLGSSIPTLSKVYEEFDEQINAAQDSLLSSVTSTASEVSASATSVEEMRDEVIAAKESIESAFSECTELINSVMTGEALLASAEELFQSSIANLGLLLLKNKAATTKIKIPETL